MSGNPHTSRSRNAALRRLGRANRWLIAGSATLTGVLTAIAASAFPGKTLEAPHTTTSHEVHPSVGATGTRTSSGASSGTAKLKASAQAPQSSTTGGSSSTTEGSSSSQSSSSSGEESSATHAETTETPVTSGGS